MLGLPVNIVYAEDDEDDVFFFRETLHEISATVRLTAVKDGRQLMDYLKSHIPDIIFLDINMPYKTGLECLHEIKKSEVLKHIPVIMLSTSGNENDIRNALNGQASLYVVKPSNGSLLLEILSKILDRFHSKTLLYPLEESFVLSA